MITEFTWGGEKKILRQGEKIKLPGSADITLELDDDTIWLSGAYQATILAPRACWVDQEHPVVLVDRTWIKQMRLHEGGFVEFDLLGKPLLIEAISA